MDWSKVGQAIAKTSPLLGSILGGPVGAVASAAGSLIASFLGVEPKPEAVSEAIKNNPEVLLRLKELELRHQEALLSWQTKQIEAETARITAVNLTMQKETEAEKWPQYSWRPFWGFISALAFLGTVLLVGILAYRAVIKGDLAAINMIPQMITSLTTLFAIPGAILGVSAWYRGKEKIEKARKGSVFNG